MSTQEVVLGYFQAWQNKEWNKMKLFLAKDFKSDGGQIQFQNRETFIEFCKSGPSWKKITLLDALFHEKKAALLYEGVAPSGEKLRVAEFLELDQGTIQSSKTAIALG